MLLGNYEAERDELVTLAPSGSLALRQHFAGGDGGRRGSVTFACEPAGMAAGVAVIGGLFVAVIAYVVRRGTARTHVEARLECVARAFLAGLFSGLTGFLAKFTVVAIEAMIRARSAADLRRYEFWLMLLALPVSIVLQLRELNGGLRRFDATEVVPMYQAAIVIWGVTFGWGFYEENADLGLQDEILFAVGVAISIAGIAAIGVLKRPAADADTEAKTADAAAALDEGAVDASKLLSGDAEDSAPSAPAADAPLFAPALGTGAHAGAGATDAERTATSKRVVAPASHEFPMPGAGFIEAVTAFAPSSVARLVAPSDTDRDDDPAADEPERRSLLADGRGVSLPAVRR